MIAFASHTPVRTAFCSHFYTTFTPVAASPTAGRNAPEQQNQRGQNTCQRCHSDSHQVVRSTGHLGGAATGLKRSRLKSRPAMDRKGAECPSEIKLDPQSRINLPTDAHTAQ
jgi:hypothetical protein